MAGKYNKYKHTECNLDVKQQNKEDNDSNVKVIAVRDEAEKKGTKLKMMKCR